MMATKGCGQLTSNYTKFSDSQFIVVKTAEGGMAEVVDYCGPVKTVHKGFCLAKLEQLIKYWPVVSYLVMRITPRVTGDSSVRVIQAVLKYKTDADNKEVIRLDVYSLCLPLPLTMTLHLHRGRWWPILFTPYSKFVTTRKDLIQGIKQPADSLNLSLVVQKVPIGTLRVWKCPQGFTWYCSQSQSINILALYYSYYCTPPP